MKCLKYLFLQGIFCDFPFKTISVISRLYTNKNSNQQESSFYKPIILQIELEIALLSM